MGVPPWEFDSPLRHHAYNNGFRESDDFLKPLFFCAFFNLPLISSSYGEILILILYSLRFVFLLKAVFFSPYGHGQARHKRECVMLTVAFFAF